MANPSAQLTSSSCCIDHILAHNIGALVQGSHIGTFSSTCSTNITDNAPAPTPGGPCGNDEYLDGATCISKMRYLIF